MKIPANSSSIKPCVVADEPCVCGEGPLWHPMEKKLYWTDIDCGKIFRYDPKTKSHEQVFTGPRVGGMTLQTDGSLLLFMDKGQISTWNSHCQSGEYLKTIITEIPAEKNARFNDVIADPRGRVFCGTLGEKPSGNLYRLDTDGSLHHLLSDIGCSNGMAFTHDLTTFYYVDSVAQTMYAFDYDIETGNISRQRTFITLPKELGLPDGMTIDAQGDIWLAVWDGSCLLRFAADGSPKQKIAFPTVKRVSSVAFGGDDLSLAYCTTAGGDDRATQGIHAGSLFELDLGVKGRAEFFSKVGI